MDLSARGGRAGRGIPRPLQQEPGAPLLKSLGWTPQIPLTRAIQRDEAAIQRWQTRTWPQLLRQALHERRTLVFIDEAGFYLLPSVVRTYAPRGVTPILRECSSLAGHSHASRCRESRLKVITHDLMILRRHRLSTEQDRLQAGSIAFMRKQVGLIEPFSRKFRISLSHKTTKFSTTLQNAFPAWPEIEAAIFSSFWQPYCFVSLVRIERTVLN
ncbi:MAG: transposase [Pedosphaera sp.]|nr:transposase [Pedosphaera sp.]